MILPTLCLSASLALSQTQSTGAPGTNNVQTEVGDLRTSTTTRFVTNLEGVDAGARIREAIETLPPTGGTIDTSTLEGPQTISTDPFPKVTKPVRLVLGSGTYTLKVAVTVPNRVSIQGRGEQTIIKKSRGIKAGFSITGSDVEITGLRFEPEHVSGQPNTDIKLENAAGNIRIHNNTFSAPFATVTHYSAITAAVDSKSGGSAYTTPVRGVFIESNKFEGYARPVFLHSCENITIRGNYFKDTNFDAIRLRENDGYIIIEGNQFDNIGDPAWPDDQTRDAVDTYVSGTRLIIANNIVRKTAYVGFDVKGANSTATNQTERVIITGNIVEDTRHEGIKVTGDLDYDGAGTPLHTRFIDVSHNQVYSCNQQNSGGTGSEGDAGITILAPSKLTRVADNIVALCHGRGIFLGGGVDSTEQSENLIVTGNLVTNNGRSGSATTSGIVVIGTKGLIFTNNMAINDPTLPNPYQRIGISINSSTTASPVSHLQIVNDNIARGNTVNQILVGPNNERASGLSSFFNNVQEGAGAVHRPTWQGHRGLFFGDGTPPGPGDGQFRQGDIILNDMPSVSGHVGLINTSSGAPGTWLRWGRMQSVSADNGNAGATLTVGVSATTQRWNTALTADRTVSLSTAGAQNGDKFRIVREAGATGAFKLNVGPGPLKTLTAAGQWCEVEFDGSAWRLVASGSL